MYKVLIIDDEEPVRLAIRALGQWEELQFGRIEEAMDGQQGLEQLRQLQPDLVFVDMKMPYMNGVEFLNAAVQERPEAKYVVVSGYGDFQYAQEAMRAGALEYMLKPVNRKELHRVMCKAAEQLGSTRRQREEKVTESIRNNITAPLVREKIFSSMIDQSGRFHRIGELEELLGIEIHRSSFRVAVVRVRNEQAVCSGKFRGDEHAYFFALCNALNELCKPFAQAFSFRSGGVEREFVVVMTAQLPAAASEVYSGLTEAVAQLEAIFGTEAMAAFGERARPLEELHDAYEEAAAILEGANLLDPRQRVYSGVPCALQAERPSLLTHKEALQHALETGSPSYACSMVRQFFAEARAGGYFSLEHMKCASAELRLLLEYVMKQAELPRELRTRVMRNFDQTFQYPYYDLEKLASDAAFFVQEAVETMLETLKPRDRINLNQMKEYIDRHYYQDISIPFFCEKYYVSKEHLLRLFKQKFGCGIHEYIQRVRMSKAKELLRDPHVKVSAVCELVGYRDNNYFSKAFKKYFGESPNEYRSQLQPKH
ncbi:response regulator transcription factor [Paenibacillus turpanensis]|uniref:response regulator transcription factor n=1 Tax=Paenibacillus turpanensis TaxID=2689078 RepID=UPI00140BA860|nr:response regulator [Paenibacillus turpanensis]